MKIQDLIIKTGKVKWQDLKDLQPENLKVPYHSEKTKKSIIDLGFAQAIYVWEDPKTQELFVCDGHLRKDILLELIADGFDVPDKLPCTFLDNEKIKTKEEAIKYLLRVFNIKHNPIDEIALKDWLEEVDLSLEEICFEDLDINIGIESCSVKGELTKRNSEDVLVEDLTNEAARYIQIGDIVELQGHRLMCGDSFDKNCIDKLLNGSVIDAIYTDPPYGMNLDTDFSQMIKYSNSSIAGVAGKTYKKVEGDDKPFDPTFILQTFEHINEIFLWGANYYADKLPNLAMGKCSWIVWDKRVEMDNDGEIKSECTFDFSLSEFELCWSKKKHQQKVARFLWMGMNGCQYEGEEAKANQGSVKRIHPNQKPVRMINWFFNEYLQKQKNILDLFGGSGSTLIACQQSQKNCFMMEYDPQYVEVIITRFIKMYGSENIFIIREGKRMSMQDIKQI